MMMNWSLAHLEWCWRLMKGEKLLQNYEGYSGMNV
jgi:hypothetical protein